MVMIAQQLIAMFQHRKSPTYRYDTMATSAKQETFTLTIQLSEEEAIWLKANLQNSLHDLETTEDSEIRKAIWDALEVINT